MLLSGRWRDSFIGNEHNHIAPVHALPPSAIHGSTAILCFYVTSHLRLVSCAFAATLIPVHVTSTEIHRRQIMVLFVLCFGSALCRLSMTDNALENEIKP